MMIGIPMAAAIGGIATPAGSGLNVLSLDLLKRFGGVEINFLQWTMLGVPTAAVLVLSTWFIITLMYKPEITHVVGLDDIAHEKKMLGKIAGSELKFCIIFGITLINWVCSVWTGIPIHVTAAVMATMLFMPGIDILDWRETQKNIGWEALLLVGTSSSLAGAMQAFGAATWIAGFISFSGMSIFAMIFAVVAFGVFSHLILPVGNAALAVCIPVIAAMATAGGVNPAILVIPLGFCASCIFLIPVDPIPLTTYQHGYWRMIDMMKPGWIASVVWIVVLSVFAYIANMVGVFG